MSSNIDFPSGTTGISPLYFSIQQNSKRETIRSPFESGYEQTRSKFTRAIKEWRIMWDHMSLASHTTLTHFFENTVKAGASSWNWHNPLSGTTFEVRFIEDELNFTNYGRDYFKGSINIREV